MTRLLGGARVRVENTPCIIGRYLNRESVTPSILKKLTENQTNFTTYRKSNYGITVT
jgi:hypothetical protein